MQDQSECRLLSLKVRISPRAAVDAVRFGQSARGQKEYEQEWCDRPLSEGPLFLQLSRQHRSSCSRGGVSTQRCGLLRGHRSGERSVEIEERDVPCVCVIKIFSILPIFNTLF